MQPYMDPPFLDGNHVMYKTLRAVCVALIRDPGLIAYIPSRKNGTLYGMRNDAIFPAYDLVIYGRTTQLNRHGFQQARRLISYRRPQQLTIRYSVKRFMDYCIKESRAYEKRNPGYYFDTDWKLYEEDSTYYSEGNRLLLCDSYIDIAEFTDGVNLEAEVRKDMSSPFCHAFGYEMGYLTKSIRRYFIKNGRE